MTCVPLRLSLALFAVPCAQRAAGVCREPPFERAPADRADGPRPSRLVGRATRPLAEVCAGLRSRERAGWWLK